MAEDYQNKDEITDALNQEDSQEAKGDAVTEELSKEKLTEEEKEAIAKEQSRIKKLKNLKQFVMSLLAFLVVWLVVYSFTHYMFGFIVVDGDSMNDTMVNEQVGIIQKFNKQKIIHRGDIIVFWSDELDEYLIKRCVAIGGDTLSMTDGVLTVNGKKVTEDYIKEPMEWNNEIEEITLSEDSFFAMGDNRNASMDCRDLGPVYMDDITGKLVINLGAYGITFKRLIIIIIVLVFFIILMGAIYDRKVEKKLAQIPSGLEDFEIEVDVSTCTGEMTIGFRNPYTHRLENMELVHNNKEIKAYCMRYAQDYKHLLKK